nr:reverse transcriptase domain-containing protein [Tanacetum cinerariifolium]
GSRADPTLFNGFVMAAEGNGDPPVPDLWNMEELCQPSLNGRGGTFMKRHPEECYDLIENMTAHHNDWDTLAQRSESSSSINSFSDPEIAALKSEMAKINKNLMRVLQVGSNRFGSMYMLREPIKVVTLTNLKENDAILKNMQTNMTSLTNSNLELKNMFGQFMKMNTASSSGSRTLPSNTITNPNEDLKGITPRTGTVYQRPTIPTTSSSLPKVVERTFHFPADFVVIDFDVDPRVPLILGRSFLKTKKDLIDVYEGELTLRDGKEAITFNLDQTLRYTANYNDMTANQIDVIDMACEEYLQEVLGFSDVIVSLNPTPYYDLIVSTSSPNLTPFENRDFLLKEVDAFLALEDNPTSPEFDHSYFDTEGDILPLEAFLNDDPSLPSPNQGNYFP